MYGDIPFKTGKLNISAVASCTNRTEVMCMYIYINTGRVYQLL